MKIDTRSVLAEFIGTFALCFIGAGAICTNQMTGGYVGLLGIAIAHGAVLAVMVSCLGHISGGHINPAVTLGALAAKKIDPLKAVSYIIAQLAGGVSAGYVLIAIFPAEVWIPVRLGTPMVAASISMTSAILLEAVLTFFLVFTVFATAIDQRGAWKAIGGFGIGTVLVFDILVGGPLTGASMNPARTFGPAVVSGTWDSHIVYWIGPILGGLAASFVYSRIFLETKRR